MWYRWKRLGQAESDLPLLNILELRVAGKLEKLPRKCVFELSEPLLGPGIGLWGIVGSVLARLNQIYLF